ncbi:MAG TPA: hypothetical protein VMW52_09545, partial [Phycisphaerae bacterium]|nr:hypothetical protein [Phycisphaerae bacterium]
SEAIPPGTLSAEQTRRLVARFGEAYHREAFVDALITEGLNQQAMLSNSQWFSMYGRRAPEMVVSLVTAQERNTSARVMNRLIEVAPLPYYEAVEQLRPIQAELDKKPDSYFGVIRSYVKSIFMRGPGRYLESNALFEALLDVARLGLLIEDYQRQHGTCPESLEILAPEFGGTIPMDPMSGQAYIYKPGAEGFLLYSAGLNGKDDGGKGGRIGEDDLVWRRWMRQSKE